MPLTSSAGFWLCNNNVQPILGGNGIGMSRYNVWNFFLKLVQLQWSNLILVLLKPIQL